VRDQSVYVDLGSNPGVHRDCPAGGWWSEPAAGRWRIGALHTTTRSIQGIRRR